MTTMPTYTYQARDAGGKRVKGKMTAASKIELAEKLNRMGYMTTRASEALPGISVGPLFDQFRGVGSEDMIMFNVQLSNLIHAGVSILSSLSTLSQQVENKKLRDTITDVCRSVESGESFSEAVSHHPRIFSRLFINMVKAGEASGKLDRILERFAAYSEEQAEIREKIRGSLFYPIILLFAGIAVTLFIVTFVIPQFAEIFMRVGIPLPLPTLLLYRTGILIKQFWYSIILFSIVGWLGLRYYGNTPRGRLHVDWLTLKLPVLGTLSRKASISRFGRTLGMLVSSGVPILQSLEIVREIIGNEVLARVVENTRAAVEKGERMSETIRISGEFPLDTVQMISVGEETGNLDEMLDKISDFYDRSVGYSIKKLTTVIEPLLLIIMGSLVGFIMASMLLPMFDMMKILRQARSGF